MRDAEQPPADTTAEQHPGTINNALGAMNKPLTAAAPPARSTGKKALVVFGAGALLAGGGVFAYNSLHQSEEAFNADGEEYAQVCQDTNTGLRAEDSECEKAEQQENNSGAEGSSGNSGDTQNNNNHAGTTHHNSGATNAFLWYYLGRRSAGGQSTIPAVGSSLSGGSTTRPQTGTVYSGISRSGGGFESSYKSAKKTSNYSSGKVTQSRSGGKTTNLGNKGSSSSNKGGTSSNRGGSKGGFGGGSKSGGGTSGG